MRSRLFALVQQYPYADKWLWLLGIPLITLSIQHIGVDTATLRVYIQDTTYWQNLFFNGLMTTLALMIHKLIVLELDQHLPYQTHFKKRVLWQVSLTIGVILSVIVLGTYLFVKVWAKADYWETFYHTDLPAAAGIVLMLNFFYLGLYFRNAAPNTFGASQQTQEEAETTLLEVQIGNKRLLLAPRDIALCYSQNKITRCLSFEGKTYLVDQSLKGLSEILPIDLFFQANRQLLLNRASLKGYQRLPNRKLLLSFHESISYQESVHVSKEKSPHFLKWLSA